VFSSLETIVLIALNFFRTKEEEETILDSSLSTFSSS